MSTPANPAFAAVMTQVTREDVSRNRPQRPAQTTTASPPVSPVVGICAQLPRPSSQVKQRRRWGLTSVFGIGVNSQNKGRKPAPKGPQTDRTSAAAPLSPTFTEGSDVPCDLPPQSAHRKGMNTLVLDLDETLVHSSFRPMEIAAFVIPVEIEGRTYDIYVNKRPGVDQFLKFVSNIFEIVIYTASLSKYANPLMNRLDPDGRCDHRLFREACTFVNGSYIKDLSKLGRDLRGVLILDNSPTSYSFQPDNAIPIKSWFDDMNDRELSALMPILEALSTVKNIPHVIYETISIDAEDGDNGTD